MANFKTENMKRIKILLLVSLLTGIFACENKPFPRSIMVADSLIYCELDSAVALLKHLEGAMAFEPKATQMYYQLLNIKARDKAYITHTSDSLIKTVVEYYEDKKDRERLPEAYYYAGRVYRDLGDAPRALGFFQNALETSNEDTNDKLIGLMYYQMGMIFLYQDIYDKALDAFNESCHYSKLSGDSISIIYNLRDIGRAYTGLNNVDSTLYYYKKADQIARKINSPYLIRIINQELTNIYTQLGEYEKAKLSLRKASITNKKYSPAYYSVLAYLYYNTGKIDSAKYYYKKLIGMGNYYQKQNAYKRLYEITHQEGNFIDALNHIDNYLIYTDSIQKTIHAEAVHKVNALYNYHLQEKEINNLKITAQEQRVWIIFLASSIILFFMAGITVIIVHRQRMKQKKIQAERQKEKLEEISEAQYLNSQAYIAKNKKRIEELSKQIQNTENQKNELKQQQEESEKELLELTNKLIESRQKVQVLSEAALKDSQIYKDFYHVAGMPNSKNISDKSKITEEDWDELIAAIDKTYNNFTWRLQKLYPKISEQEIRICVLLKISINPQSIATLLLRSRQAMDSARKKLYRVTHNQDGTAAMWDDFIKTF